MRIFRNTYPGPNGTRQPSKRWTIEFRDPANNVHRIARLTDKRLASEFGRKLDRLTEMRLAGVDPSPDILAWLQRLPSDLRTKLADEWGMVPRTLLASTEPLAVHIAAYLESKRAERRAPTHVRNVEHYLRAVVGGAGAVHAMDITLARVERYLAALMASGSSPSTRNHYAAAFRAFCRWLVVNRVLPESPVVALRNLATESDQRRKRRALSLDDLIRLLETTHGAPKRYGLTGPDRAWIYRFQAETGFRAGECRSITPKQLDLDCEPPTATVTAAYAKNRRQRSQPLRPAMVEYLREHIADIQPDDPVFPLPSQTSAMLQDDLADAEIPYEDDQGRVFDFHALRGQFATHLAQTGARPDVARKALDHSTIALTIDLYTHTTVRDVAEAVARLPDLEANGGPENGENG